MRIYDIINEDAGGPYRAILNSGEKPEPNIKSKSFRSKNAAIKWADEWYERNTVYIYASAVVVDRERDIVWNAKGLTGQTSVAEEYDAVGFLKQIISDIHPRGGDRKVYFRLVRNQVPSKYGHTAKFKRDFNKAYDAFYSITRPDGDDGVDYTNYTMRQGELNNPDRMREGEYDPSYDPEYRPQRRQEQDPDAWKQDRDNRDDNEPEKVVYVIDNDTNEVVLKFKSTGGFYGDERYAQEKGIDLDSGQYSMKWKRVKVDEAATAGATSAANVAVGPVYKNKPAKAAKNKDGTVKNALDMKANLITGGSIKR